MCIQTIGSCSMLTKTATNMNSNPDLLTRELLTAKELENMKEST